MSFHELQPLQTSLIPLQTLSRFPIYRVWWQKWMRFFCRRCKRVIDTIFLRDYSLLFVRDWWWVDPIRHLLQYRLLQYVRPLLSEPFATILSIQCLWRSTPCRCQNGATVTIRLTFFFKECTFHRVRIVRNVINEYKNYVWSWKRLKSCLRIENWLTNMYHRWYSMKSETILKVNFGQHGSCSGICSIYPL